MRRTHHGPNRLRQEISDSGLSAFARRHGERDSDGPELFLSFVYLLCRIVGLILLERIDKAENKFAINLGEREQIN